MTNPMTQSPPLHTEDEATASLREALEQIRELVSKRQLPITNQVYEIADAALAHGERVG